MQQHVVQIKHVITCMLYTQVFVAGISGVNQAGQYMHAVHTDVCCWHQWGESSRSVHACCAHRCLLLASVECIKQVITCMLCTQVFVAGISGIDVHPVVGRPQGLPGQSAHSPPL